MRVDLPLAFEDGKGCQHERLRDRIDQMKIVRLNSGIFLINDLARMQHDAAVHRAIIDELLESLLGSVIVLQLESANLRTKLCR